MIRIAFGLGILALLTALGIVLYREYQPLRVAGDPSIEIIPPQPPAAPAPAEPAVPDANPRRAEPAPESPAPVAERPATAPVPATPQMPAPTTRRTHRVREGDSLWKISREYYGTPECIEFLAEANGMDSSKILRLGQLLIIPERRPRGTPPDADHEAVLSTVPRAATPDSREPLVMPPTLSHTLPNPSK